MAYYISRASERVWTDSTEIPGLRTALLVGAEHGAQHMEVSLRELAPGAVIDWHFSPFEDSWFVEAGTGTVALGGLEYELGVGDYGVAPARVGHSITAGDEGLRWFSVQSPKPPTYAGARPRIACQPVQGEKLGRPSETDPRHRYAGHFELSDMAPVGDIDMPGYHGPNIKNISIRMMVDQLLGAQHHTMFMATIAPKSGPGRAAKVHYHPFEEIYYYKNGGMSGLLDGDQVTTYTGDLVWIGVGGTHGFVNENEEPARWIEVQAPVPPTSDGFYFPDDWLCL
jgi:mannose-6-phosphate isomerase-like protein (cupin superfamily)